MRDYAKTVRGTGPAGGGIRWLQVVSIAGFMLLGLYLLVPHVDIAGFLAWLRAGGPWFFYLAFALLTLVGFPSTPFFLIGGAAFPLWQNVVGATLGMALHFILAFLVSSCWLRQSMRRLLEKRGLSPPDVQADNAWRVAVMLKFAPGVPMFLKSHLMGVAGIPFKVFMIVSMASTWVYAVAVLTMGKSAMEGHSGWFLGGLALLIFATAGWRFVKARADKS
jgi:uncharacterized membrane protein YdjX (TVP38/TMEM64 family)